MSTLLHFYPENSKTSPNCILNFHLLYFTVLHYFIHFSDYISKVSCFLQIEGLWQCCIEQVYWAIGVSFSTALVQFTSLCHILVILTLLSMGSQRVRHNWATEQQYCTVSMLQYLWHREDFSTFKIMLTLKNNVSIYQILKHCNFNLIILSSSKFLLKSSCLYYFFKKLPICIVTMWSTGIPSWRYQGSVPDYDNKVSKHIFLVSWCI